MKDFNPTKQIAPPNLTKPMRVTGSGIYDNNPTCKPKTRCMFNYYYDHIKPKPQSELDNIVGLFEDKELKKKRDNEVDRSTNDFYVRFNGQGMNKSRSAADYFAPFAWGRIYKPLGCPLLKESYQKEKYENYKHIENLFYNYGKGYTPKGVSLNILLKQKTQDGNKRNHEMKSVFNSSVYPTRNNYTSGLININKLKNTIDQGLYIDRTTVKHDIFKTTSIYPIIKPTYDEPALPNTSSINRVMRNKFQTIIDASCVSEYTFRQFFNEKYNLNLYQREEFIDDLSGIPQDGLFCLFDGTNGSEVVDYCKDHFSFIFQHYLDFNPKSVHRFVDPRKPPNPKDAKRSKRAMITSTETLFLNSFNKLDDELKTLNQPHMGACACIIFFTNEMEKIGRKDYIKRYLYCCNSGDIHCVLLTRHNIAVNLAVVHTDRDPNEHNRLKEAVGYSHKMVFGKIPYTRAFGHYDLKHYGMTSTPHVIKYNIDEDRDQYVIMGTRGVFQHMTNADLLYYVQEYHTTEDIVNKIISNAMENNVKENLSCFVIKL